MSSHVKAEPVQHRGRLRCSAAFRNSFTRNLLQKRWRVCAVMATYGLNNVFSR